MLTFQERHARMLASGLTRYSFADVAVALGKAEYALTEIRTARQLCCDALAADAGYTANRMYPLAENYIETDAAKAAYKLLRTDPNRKPCLPNFPFEGDAQSWFCGSMSSHSREAFPLTRWATTVRAWRKWSELVRKSLGAVATA